MLSRYTEIYQYMLSRYINLPGYVGCVNLVALASAST